MKKQYENPDMEIVEVKNCGDVLTLSEEWDGSTGESGDWELFE